MNKDEELKPCPFCHREAQQTLCSGLVSCAYEDCPAFLLAVFPENWNTRAQRPSQGGEAVAQVFTTWHPDSRSYEEQIVSHDTKGSRKALGAMNAKLRAKVGRLERELATVKQSLTVEPVAYAAFAENGNIRMWCRSAIGMCELFDAHGNKAVPLYTAPPSPDAELAELLRESLKDVDFSISEGYEDSAGLKKRIDAALSAKP